MRSDGSHIPRYLEIHLPWFIFLATFTWSIPCCLKRRWNEISFKIIKLLGASYRFTFPSWLVALEMDTCTPTRLHHIHGFVDVLNQRVLKVMISQTLSPGFHSKPVSTPWFWGFEEAQILAFHTNSGQPNKTSSPHLMTKKLPKNSRFFFGKINHQKTSCVRLSLGQEILVTYFGGILFPYLKKR